MKYFQLNHVVLLGFSNAQGCTCSQKRNRPATTRAHRSSRLSGRCTTGIVAVSRGSTKSGSPDHTASSGWSSEMSSRIISSAATCVKVLPAFAVPIVAMVPTRLQLPGALVLPQLSQQKGDPVWRAPEGCHPSPCPSPAVLLQHPHHFAT